MHLAPPGAGAVSANLSKVTLCHCAVVLKQEILRVQILDLDVVELDRAAAVSGQIEYHGGPIGGDRQILESGNARDRREIDHVFPVGEVLNPVVAVTRG